MNKKIYIILFVIFSLTASAQGKLDVFFDFDKHDLNDAAVKKINSWIAEGKNYQVIKLYGFCDWKGTNAYNDTLAIKRVNQVYSYLKESSIEVKKDIEIRGFGEDFEQSKVQGENRRVTIIFQEKKLKTPAIPLKIIPKTLVEKIQNANLGDKIVLENINFRNNSAAIMPNSKGILYDLLCIMEENQNLKIEIQGHICCQLIEDYNQVSTARARAIYQFLIRNKINRKRMTYKGFGVQFPIFKIPEKNENEENQNRRVEILIVAH